MLPAPDSVLSACRRGLVKFCPAHSTAGHGNNVSHQRKQTVVNASRYGAWDELKAQIRQSWRFRFDWFFKSRTPQVRIVTCSRHWYVGNAHLFVCHSSCTHWQAACTVLHLHA